MCHYRIWYGYRQAGREVCYPLLPAQVHGGVLPGGRACRQGWPTGSLYTVLHIPRRETTEEDHRK